MFFGYLVRFTSVNQEDIILVRFSIHVDMRVVIVGSGIIGRSWSVIHARAKHDVFLFDSMPSLLDAALAEISEQLGELYRYDLLFNQTADETLKRIQTVDTIGKLNELFEQGIDHIQECIPEDVDMKTKLFLQWDVTVPSTVLIASSSSCIVPSKFTEGMKTRHRCIVAYVAAASVRFRMFIFSP